jgi:hypothetical protein
MGLWKHSRGGYVSSRHPGKEFEEDSEGHECEGLWPLYDSDAAHLCKRCQRVANVLAASLEDSMKEN